MSELTLDLNESESEGTKMTGNAKKYGNMRRRPAGLQDPEMAALHQPEWADELIKNVKLFYSEANRKFTLRLNLSGPPGCPVTRLKMDKNLLMAPLSTWKITFDGTEHVIKHAEQNLDSGLLILHLGAEWQEPEHYQARLLELVSLGWVVLPEDLPVVKDYKQRKVEIDAAIERLEFFKNSVTAELARLAELP